MSDTIKAEFSMDPQHGPAVSTLPDCMMPDGDSPCHGYISLREKAEMMATALHRIGEVTLVPGNWSVSDWPSLDGMVAAVRQMAKETSSGRRYSTTENDDMTGLQMKYFVLKPSGDDAYAKASRAAMRAYANHIGDENPGMRDDLLRWADSETPALNESEAP